MACLVKSTSYDLVQHSLSMPSADEDAAHILAGSSVDCGEEVFNDQRIEAQVQEERKMAKQRQKAQGKAGMQVTSDLVPSKVDASSIQSIDSSSLQPLRAPIGRLGLKATKASLSMSSNRPKLAIIGFHRRSGAGKMHLMRRREDAPDEVAGPNRPSRSPRIRRWLGHNR